MACLSPGPKYDAGCVRVMMNQSATRHSTGEHRPRRCDNSPGSTANYNTGLFRRRSSEGSPDPWLCRFRSLGQQISAAVESGKILENGMEAEILHLLQRGFDRPCGPQTAAQLSLKCDHGTDWMPFEVGLIWRSADLTPARRGEERPVGKRR